MNRCFQGDCRTIMRQLTDDGVKVQTIVTSPPYFGLRDYGVAGQIGLEPTMQEYIANLVEVFDVARELLADDGTLWLNLGDSYAGSGKGGQSAEKRSENWQPEYANKGAKYGFKPKDLMGIPWRVAFALQESGWYLRQDIIWSKKNPMPESVKDRCTKAHEYIFLMSKSPRYYFDAEAIAEPIASSTAADPRLTREGYETGRPERGYPGSASHGSGLLIKRPKGNAKTFRGGGAYTQGRSFDNDAEVERESHGNSPNETGTRNKRSVWEVATQPFKEAHFATFPPALIEPCILAGSRPGDIVFDPFMGSGTVAQVAQQLGRKWLGAELNPAYIEMQAKRTIQQGLMLA